MVSGIALFFGLFNNLAIFIVLVAVYGVLNGHLEKSSLLTRQPVMGFFFGLFAIGCMYVKIPVFEGVIVDQRNAIVTLSGAFGGPLAAVICAAMAGSYRAYLGGGGVLSGVTGVCLAATAGVCLYQSRDRIDSVPKAFIGAMAATLMILPGFLLVKDLHTGWELMQAMAVPFGSAICIGIFLVGLLLAHQEHRHKAQVEQKESEKRFRELFANAPIPLAYASLDGKIITINESFGRIIGFTLEDIPDLDHWWKLAYPDPDYRNQVMRSWQNHASLAKAKNSALGPAEYRVTCKDGTRLTMIIGANVIGDTMLVSFFDITAQREKEFAIRESMELLRATFNATSDGIMVVNKDLKVTQANRQFYKMWQLPPDLQKTDDEAAFREFVQDQLTDVAGFQDMVNALYHSQLQEMHEIPFKDGRVFECYSAPMVMDQKEIGRVWDFRDITARKQAEKAIDFERRQLLSIFNSLNNFIYVSDPFTYELLFANQRLRDSIGNDPTGRLCYRELQEKDEPCDFCTNHIILNNGGLPHRWENHNPVMHIDIDIIDQIIRWPDGRDVRLEIAVDITERKHAEAERNKLQDQLLQSQKLEAVGVLAGGVAHDFNNMLRAIIGYAELTLEKMAPEDPFRQNIERILDAAKRSASITRQLLAFARKQTIAPVVFDLNESVDTILKMSRRLIGENIELAWFPGTAPCTVRMDPSQLDQILVNLCINARDAIADVGKITIETGKIFLDETYCATHAEVPPGDYALLSVSDNGSGMDKETLNHIFEPFFTTKGLGRGTGMGLATIYGIVKQNNGFINVYSELGAGTTFTIHIPLNAVESVEVQTVKAEDIPSSRGETILIIEDDPAILEMSAMMLRHLGYAVLSAGAPGEAIRIAMENSSDIDLVITDVVMPEMNGRDIVDRLLAIRPKIRHLYMSGYTANVIAHQGVLDPGVNFIQKPFSLKNLAIKIREVLG